MTQRTRYFLVGSGLVVAVGLCTGLVAHYSGVLGEKRVPATEFAYVPANVTAVAYADVRHIMNSEFHQRLRALMPAGPEKERLLAETGIDLERDIDTVVAGLGPGGVAGGSIVLVRGRFNAAHIEAVAVEHGAVVEEFHRTRILKLVHTGASNEPGGDQPSVAFLEPGLIALGQVDAVRSAIEHAERNESVAANAELMKVVDDVAGDGNAWIVGRVDSMSDSAKLPDVVREHLAGLQWFSLSAGVDRTVSCRLKAEAKDEQSGAALRDVVNGAIAMTKVMAGKDSRLDDLLQSVQARGTGPQIELSFTVPAEALDALRSGASAAQPNLQQPR